MTKILVTGGAGFIGSTLTAMLVKNGDEVVVADDLSLGREYELADVSDKITLIKGDLIDPLVAEKAVEGVEQIYHLAAASSAPMYEPDPTHATHATLTSFVNILEAARKKGIKNLVYASSSSVYGKNQVPHSEDQHVAPVSFYTAAKLSTEHYAEAYCRTHGMRIAAMRFFSVYGTRERHKGKYANVVTQFLWDMKKNISPVIYGDGEQTRDYVFAEDVARCCTLAMEAKVHGPFNVGTGVAHSFNETVDLLNKALGTSVEAKRIPNPISKTYVAHTLADTRKSSDILGFEAKYSFEDGIKAITKAY